MKLSQLNLEVYGFYIGAFLFGFAALLYGTNNNNLIISTFGGSFVGASLSSLLSRKGNNDIINNFALLNQTQKLTSEDAKLEFFRDKPIWHMYHVTRLRDGKLVWRYTLYDFSHVNVPGYLQAHLKISHPENGEKQNRIAEAAVRNNKLIILKNNNKKSYETPAEICIFSNPEQTWADEYYGIADITTWHKNLSLSPVILLADSYFKKKNYGNEGTITDLETIKKMNEEWKSEMKKLHYDLLPLPLETDKTTISV